MSAAQQIILVLDWFAAHPWAAFFMLLLFRFPFVVNRYKN